MISLSFKLGFNAGMRILWHEMIKVFGLTWGVSLATCRDGLLQFILEPINSCTLLYEFFPYHHIYCL